ncbi:sodium:solute symporter family protein [Methylobacillus caricis]|uniref:sodium:solute symporter family protein n=1 Tax=Methylobacillus caricis TaxID=1971611 RepID=UPI001CFFAC6B|nr:sodium:solute symporter family protein [Methylobacillus caricis]MCB5186629.1 sodium:solute symporter family protein [Methylobacillus caricis]
MIITFGLMLAFFAVIVLILQLTKRKDQSFTDYAVGGRSFNAKFQAMSFLNTWYPGAMFTAFGGLAAASGVISFYVLVYSLLTVVLMYAMAQRVWVWGKQFDLKTQPDLFSLRYNSKHIRTIAAIIGIISGIPWLVLGMQALGGLFQYMSLGTLSFSTAVILGVLLIALRQVWTVRMGMRGVVISDMAQGIVAYLIGTLVLVGLILWLIYEKGSSLSTLEPEMFSLPDFGSKEGPFYVFSLILTGTVGGWCWPYIFVRLFTADSVHSLKKSAALAMPLSLVFGSALLLFGMFSSVLPSVAAQPTDVWFLVSQEAGGVFLLGIAGVILLAASMGHIDGNIQATGAQIANDLIGNYRTLSHPQLIFVAKFGMVLLTALSAWLACMKLPTLFSLAVLAYQGIIQLAVPQFLGIFWKKGNALGAIVGMIAGFVTAITLEMGYVDILGQTYGITSGLIGLAVNLVIYIAAAYLVPHSGEEQSRVEALFRVSDSKSQSHQQIVDTANVR